VTEEELQTALEKATPERERYELFVEECQDQDIRVRFSPAKGEGWSMPALLAVVHTSLRAAAGVEAEITHLNVTKIRGAQQADVLARSRHRPCRGLAIQPRRRRADRARHGHSIVAGPMSDATPPDLTPSRPVYDGKLGELYGIYLRHLLLMLLTLGWSRFWGRTRLRRYLWSHFSILGDRFEYRGRGLELFIGFIFVLLILAAWGGLVWLVWHFAIEGRGVRGFGLIDAFSLTVAFIGFPLAFVGQYAGLRYRLTRTRWRGIRGTLAGSAWGFGVIATLLTFANAMTAQLMTPLVSVTLARPRIANASLGTQRLEFAGRAGDIYGRYIGYYFLNILLWGVVIGLAIAAFVAGGAKLGFDEAKLATIFTKPGFTTVVVILIALFVVSTLFGLLILPLRCWWQAYLFRYLVARVRAGPVLFATALSTRHMWSFMVVNYLIVVMTLGLGWPWVMHRTLRLISEQLWIYGAPDGASIRQPADRGPNYGEGLLDMFDVSGV